MSGDERSFSELCELVLKTMQASSYAFTTQALAAELNDKPERVTRALNKLKVDGRVVSRRAAGERAYTWEVVREPMGAMSEDFRLHDPRPPAHTGIADPAPPHEQGPVVPGGAPGIGLVESAMGANPSFLTVGQEAKAAFERAYDGEQAPEQPIPTGVTALDIRMHVKLSREQLIDTGLEGVREIQDAIRVLCGVGESGALREQTLGVADLDVRIHVKLTREDLDSMSSEVLEAVLDAVHLLCGVA